jgi:hypothetical protein
MKTRFLSILVAMVIVSASVHPTASADEAPPLSPSQLAIKKTVLFAAVPVRILITLADPFRRVIFLTPEQREQRRIIIVNNTVYDHTGAPFTMTNHNHNEFNYVMDRAGNFYWLDESSNPTVRHDSIFDAAPVTGAGNITIQDSKITYIDCDSGHYASEPLFPDVMNELGNDGNDLSLIDMVTSDNSDPIFHRPFKSSGN